MYRILSYVTPEGKDVYKEWADGLRDTRARFAVDRRLRRVEEGNFGDHKYLIDGIWELRIDFGPGYRVYYGLRGAEVVVVLCAGDKGSQQRDIDRAVAYWAQVEKEGQ